MMKMEEMGSPQAARYYRAYEGEQRNLELVDPITLRPIQRVFVVRESIRVRSRSCKHSSDMSPHKPKPKSSRSSSSLKEWWKDPEVKRKRRVAKYKLYTAEGKVKSSLRRGFKWVQRQCSKLLHGL